MQRNVSCRVLAAVPAGQLACGVGGMVLALRRGHAFDLPLLHGRPDTVAGDALLIGTALSPPLPMLVAQGAMTAVLSRRADRRAARGLGGLGTLMVAGYLAERLVRHRLRPSGWDPVDACGSRWSGARRPRRKRWRRP